MGFAKFDLLQWMEPDLQAAFLGRLRPRRYRRGQFIYVQGGPGNEMYRLISGFARISVLRADGRHITYKLFEPGDCFGQTSLLDEEPRPQTTEASTDVEVGVLSRTDFTDLGREFPSFGKAIMRLLTAQLRMVAHHFEGVSLEDLNVRVARQILLSCVAETHSPNTSRSQQYARLSQEELGSMVGASRQSVNKVLQGFCHQGIIAVSYRSVLVIDIDRLRKIATYQ